MGGSLHVLERTHTDPGNRVCLESGKGSGIAEPEEILPTRRKKEHLYVGRRKNWLPPSLEG